MSQEMVDILMQKPIPFEVLDKDTKEMKQYEIPRICPGCVIRLSGLIAKMDLPTEKYFQELQNHEKIKESADNLAKYGPDIINCLAMAVENNDQEPSENLVKFFRKNIDSSTELFRLFILVIKMMDYPSCLMIMGSIQGINLFKENSTPGGLSVPQSNISDGQKITSSGK